MAKKSKSHQCKTCNKDKVIYFKDGNYFCGQKCHRKFIKGDAEKQ